MNKTTEALKLAEALENDAKEHREVSYGLDCPPECTANWKHALNCEAAARLIREVKAEPVCEHRIADARNEFVRDGYICIKCGALFRAADHAEPVKQEPVNQKAVGCYYGAADHIGHVVRIDVEIPIGTLLYAAPVDAKAIRAEREWVELTDYEIVRLYAESPMCDSEMIDFARAVIAAFKEKNK